jgi:hypothetical protein
MIARGEKGEFVMSIRTFVTVAALSVASLVPTWSKAAGSTPNPCIFGEHRVVSVEPYRVDQQYGKMTIKQVRGAQVYVQAEPGLTAAYLQLQLDRHFADMKGGSAMPDCVFGIDNVRIDVSRAGAGYWVTLAAANASSGEEVLRRARLLAR